MGSIVLLASQGACEENHPHYCTRMGFSLFKDALAALNLIFSFWTCFFWTKHDETCPFWSWFVSCMKLMKHLKNPRTVLCSVHNTYNKFLVSKLQITKNPLVFQSYLPVVRFWVFGVSPPPPSYLRNFRWVHGTGPGSPRCDFLHCAAMPGKRFRPVSRAKACRMLLDAIREAAGEEVFILGAF